MLDNKPYDAILDYDTTHPPAFAHGRPSVRQHGVRDRLMVLVKLETNPSTTGRIEMNSCSTATESVSQSDARHCLLVM